MNHRLNIFCLYFFLSIIANAQEMKWWNPQNSTINAIEGQAWQGEHEGFYDRLPLEQNPLSDRKSGLVLNFHPD